ncbi:hypothetical protein APR04_003807 [Promicromonospora umidemergens]|uniref:Minor tail protein n=1 Tax=Promicromonospora umidemergens TaxID=629679 RepID=A0ABP8XG74_9MICO|nr:hypothetical protein [Promicromonospora umidemergens]MCP2284884.1 hypothetical protein [Promicromonospora umidemergens]
MTIRIMAGLLRTGEFLTQVPTTKTGASWAMSLNQAGTVEATVPLRSLPDRARDGLLANLEPWRCFLAAVTDAGRVLEAGPIQPHDYDDKSGHLKVGADGLWSLWDHRYVLDPTLAHVDLSWSGLSLGTIGKRIVETATAHDGGSLPLVLPDDIAGTHERVYPWWEYGKVAERLKQLVEVQRGPDIAFQPRLTPDGLGLEWVMRTGTDNDPLLHQVGADWQWDRGAVRSPLRLLSVKRDPSKMAFRQIITGDGMEDDRPISLAQDLTPTTDGMPLLESVESTNATDQATLDGYSSAYLQAARRPWQTWALATDQSSPEVGLYRPGDWATVHIPQGHIYLTAGEYRTRILEVSGGLDSKVNLQLAPTLENR